MAERDSEAFRNTSRHILDTTHPLPHCNEVSRSESECDVDFMQDDDDDNNSFFCYCASILKKKKEASEPRIHRNFPMDFDMEMNMTSCEKQAQVHQKSSPMPLVLVILFAVAACIIFVLTTFGNLLVLCFKARVGRTNTTLLVWNLGLTDFLVGVIVLPLGALHVILREWHFGRSLCRLWVAADVTFCTCSVVTICVISADRYLAVTRPLHYKWVVTKTKVIITIISIWCFSLSILLTTVKWEQPKCYNSKICFAGNEIRYLAHSVIFAFFMPASVTLTLYWRIYRLARNRQKALDRGFLMILGQNMNFLTNTLSQHAHLRVHYGRRSGMVEHQRRVLRTHERIAKTLGVVSCSFLFCWLPFFTLYLTNNRCQCIAMVIIDIASWLGYCNSMLNPIIYSFTVKEFKRTALRMVVPLWKAAHRCIPLLIPAPSEHITSKFSRSGARVARVTPRACAKRSLQRRVQFPKQQQQHQQQKQQQQQEAEQQQTKETDIGPIVEAEPDDVSPSGGSDENVTPLKNWKIDGETDTIEREEAVDRVIEDQQLIRAHHQENDALIRKSSKKGSRKILIRPRIGMRCVKVTKSPSSKSNTELEDNEMLAQVTDL